jgi:hypothetical protein
MNFILDLTSKVFKWAFKNPTYILMIIIISYFGFQYMENQSLKAQNKALETQIEEVQTTLTQTTENLDRLDNIEQIVQGTTNTQTIIRERIRNVPVNEEDRPFVTDPGLLARVDIMRDYQESYKSERYTTSDDK